MKRLNDCDTLLWVFSDLWSDIFLWKCHSWGIGPSEIGRSCCMGSPLVGRSCWARLCIHAAPSCDRISCSRTLKIRLKLKLKTEKMPLSRNPLDLVLAPVKLTWHKFGASTTGLVFPTIQEEVHMTHRDGNSKVWLRKRRFIVDFCRDKQLKMIIMALTQQSASESILSEDNELTKCANRENWWRESSHSQSLCGWLPQTEHQTGPVGRRSRLF